MNDTRGLTVPGPPPHGSFICDISSSLLMERTGSRHQKRTAIVDTFSKTSKHSGNTQTLSGQPGSSAEEAEEEEEEEEPAGFEGSAAVVERRRRPAFTRHESILLERPSSTLPRAPRRGLITCNMFVCCVLAKMCWRGEGDVEASQTTILVEPRSL